MSDYLQHYGVLGMKWGVRKDNYMGTGKSKKQITKERKAYDKKVTERVYNDEVVRAQLNRESTKKIS